MPRKIFLIVILMFSFLLLAEDSISLDFMVQKALEKSLSIEAELLQYKNQSSTYKQSLYNWLPRANLSLSKSWQNSEWQKARGGFSANWNISSNDGRYFDMRRQMIEMFNSNMSIEDVKKNIAFNVLSRYIDVLNAEDMVNLQEEVLAVEEQKHLRLKAQQELGEFNHLDLEQSQIDKIQAEIGLNDLNLSADNKREELFYYCGCEADETPLQKIEMQITAQPAEYQPNLQYLIQEHSLESSKLMQDQSYLELLPTLSLNWGYSRNSMAGVTEFDLYSEESEVSLLLSYPIFDYFNNYQNLQIARRQYQFNQRRLIDQQQQDKKELNSLNNSLNSRNRNLQLYIQKADLAEKLLERAQVEYQQGTISILDYNEYQNRLYSARRNQIVEHYRLLENQEKINLLLSNAIMGKW
jgi:outer membrane protein TolC